MRRLLRILLNAATALSALLCLCTVVLWVRGYWVTDRLMSTSVWPVGAGVEFRNVDVIAKRGRMGIYLHYLTDDGTANDGYPAYLLQLADAIKKDPGWKYIKDAEAGWAYPDDAPIWKPLRWSHHERLIRPGTSDAGIAVELADWMVVGLLGILPALVLWKWRRSSLRRVQGLCPGCGYDLRATPDRCPECGKTPAAATTDAPAQSPAGKAG